MFGWFTSFFSGPKQIVKEDLKVYEPTPDPNSEEDLSYYHPGERFIFKYWDGEKDVVADPMVLFKKIKAVGAELDAEFTIANSPSKEAEKADEDVLKKIRLIFNIKPLDQGGLTEPETKALFWQFMNYCEGVKKNLSE